MVNKKIKLQRVVLYHHTILARDELTVGIEINKHNLKQKQKWDFPNTGSFSVGDCFDKIMLNKVWEFFIKVKYFIKSWNVFRQFYAFLDLNIESKFGMLS